MNTRERIEAAIRAKGADKIAAELGLRKRAASSPGLAAVSETLAAARDYVARGWTPVPIIQGTKKPKGNGWQRLTADLERVERDFTNGEGVGLLLGEPSGGLTDADLDCAEALELAGDFLPATARMSGRTSRPRSHRWYVTDPQLRTVQFKDPTGSGDEETLLEIRATGGQTLAPPTMQPDGERVVWHEDGAPQRVEREELLRAARELASCVLMARHWPGSGSRHAAALAWAGALLRAGAESDLAVQLVSRAAKAAHDEEWRDRAKDVTTTEKRLARGEGATGVPTLLELGVDQRVVRRVFEWLGLREPGDTGAGGSVSSVEDPWEPTVEFTAPECGPAVPLEAMPPALGEFARDVAEANRAPLDLAAASVLGVLAAAGARRCEVQIGSTHREQLNLYLAPTAPPGERKHIKREFESPLEDEERRLFENAKPAIARIKSERDLAEARAEALRKKAAREEDAAKRAELEKQVMDLEGQLPELPARPRLFLDDATTESVAKALAAQGGRIAVLSEEAGTLFEILCGKYRDGVADLDVFLKGYDGGQIRVDRATRDAILIERPAITILVTPQPAILDRLAEREELRGRGLLGRFCFVLPPSLVGTRLYQNRSIDAVLRARYASTIGAILRLPLPAVDAIPLLRIQGEALEVWTRCHDALELAQADGGPLASIRDWASKHAGRVARLAGLFHLAEHAPHGTIPEPISAKTVAAAWAIGEWLQGHALCAFARMGADLNEVMAKRILAWIRRHGHERFTLRDLHQHHRNVNRPEDLLPALEILASRGFIRRAEDRKPGSQGGRTPSPGFLVNPYTTSQKSHNPESGGVL